MTGGSDGMRTGEGTEEQGTSTPCDACGGPTFELRCKIICRRCGFTRDCSDP
jgi:ribosomal protein L37E